MLQKQAFSNIKRFGCYFHLKYDCKLYLQKIHLYKEENKSESKEVLNEIGLIPLVYNGNIDIFNEIVEVIKNRHPNYKEFINNYFVKNKKNYLMKKLIIIVYCHQTVALILVLKIIINI